MRARIRARLFTAVAAVVFACVFLSLTVVAKAATIVALVTAGVLASAAAFGVAALSMRWFDEGVRPLTDAARRMHDGDLDVRAHVHRDEDLGELGGVFDQLAQSLSRTVGELRNERDLVARILDGMQEGVLLLHGDGNIALMNPALREMLLLRADVVDKPLLEVVRHAELKELFDRAARTNAACSGEIEVGGLKPRRLLVRATSFTQLGDGEGSRARDDAELLAVFFDVTDVRRLESLRRDFVANVSHELRTPVTAVLSAAETLDLALDKDPEGARRFLGIIERNAARLQQLIEDLLDLSRIESRELRLRPERFPFEPFGRGVLGLFRERAEGKRVRLELRAPGDLEVDLDRRALEQVLTNLVDNAVKYCPEGSTVTVDAEARPGGEVRLSVEDDGPGIPEPHLSRIFERFYRVDAGRSREMGGTGLGLAIVKHLVEAMGGTIEVRSTVGKGTTFEAILPPHGGRRERGSERDVGRDGRDAA